MFRLGTAAPIRKYSRDQPFLFIQEARQQAITGASPGEISDPYMNSDDNPFFSPFTVAKWIAMPGSGIADWLDAASHAHVALSKVEMAPCV